MTLCYCIRAIGSKRALLFIDAWLKIIEQTCPGCCPAGSIFRGTKRLVSINICSVEGNSADIFFSKVSPGIFVIKVK